MKTHILLVPTLIAAALVACENPADKTATATVSDAKGASAEAGSGDEDPAYTLGHDSTVSFIGSKVTGSHKGGFRTVHGHLHISEEGDLTGGTITIDMTSTWADDDKLTEHLKAEDFFNVKQYPESTFAITSYKELGEGGYRISGDLEMRGVTKNVTFPATAVRDGEDIKVKAEFDINRKDWGIEYAGKKDDLIRDEVVMNLDLVITPDKGHGHDH